MTSAKRGGRGALGQLRLAATSSTSMPISADGLHALRDWRARARRGSAGGAVERRRAAPRGRSARPRDGRRRSGSAPTPANCSTARVHLRRMDEDALDLADRARPGRRRRRAATGSPHGHAPGEQAEDVARRVAHQRQRARPELRRHQLAGPALAPPARPSPDRGTRRRGPRACRCMPSCARHSPASGPICASPQWSNSSMPKVVLQLARAAPASAPRRSRSRRGSAGRAAGRAPARARRRRGWRGSSACRRRPSRPRRARPAPAAGCCRCRR